MRFRVLTEGTKYDKKAITKLVDSGLFDEETSTQIVNGLFKEDIHAFNHSPAWLEKYLVGIINMLIKHCNGDPSKASSFLESSIDTFDRYLTWVKSVRPNLPSNKQLELDKKFIEMWSFEDLEKELEKIYDEMDEQSKKELANMKFGKSSNYELIPIDSFGEFKSKFGGRATGDGSSDRYAGGGGTAWCHANSSSTYSDWTRGNKRFFVLANKNWKDIPFEKESNRKNPKDEYGNSLIAIRVSKSGKLLNATLRCNHVGVSSNADNQYSTFAELSSIAGFDVEKKVKELLPKVDDANNEFDGSKQSLREYCDDLGIYPSDLKKFVIPNGVRSIGPNAFSSCISLTSITIPSSVTYIGEQAFSRCNSLPSITIPDSVTYIDREAFFNCYSLTSVKIGSGVTFLGQYAFYDCPSLTSVTIGSGVTIMGEQAFAYCKNLTDVTIEQGATTIGYQAFVRCGNLTSVSIPDSVTLIEDYAFCRCTSLTSITIPSSVQSIGKLAFYSVPDLTINCKRGSYADTYARDNGINVRYI